MQPLMRRARVRLFGDHAIMPRCRVPGARRRRDEQGGVVQHARNNSADRAANVALLIDIAIVQHGVPRRTMPSRNASHLMKAQRMRAAVARYLGSASEAVADKPHHAADVERMDIEAWPMVSGPVHDALCRPRRPRWS